MPGRHSHVENVPWNTAKPTASPSTSASSASALGRGPNSASASISGVPVTPSGSRSYTASSTMKP